MYQRFKKKIKNKKKDWGIVDSNHVPLKGYIKYIAKVII